MTRDWMTPVRPHAIAHRGASAYAPGNSLRAFEVAADLGADFWEMDLRVTADGELVVYHDPALSSGEAIADLSYADLLKRMQAPDVPVARLSEVLDLAISRGAGIYADIKADAAVRPVLEMLKQRGFERAILGAFSFEAIARLPKSECPYPRAVLIPAGVDPFVGTEEADILHLCWESLDCPQDLLDADFFARADARGQRVVLWHEEDPQRMAALRDKPVLGICSDRPELVNPYRPSDDWRVEVVCHRGANRFAPENTLAAAHCAFAAGFSHVEIDVRTSADGEMVVIHDALLERTTNASGSVTARSFKELQQLDAGGWFAPSFRGEKIPSLDEILALAKHYSGSLYVELKNAPADGVLDRVLLAGMLESCFFWSSDSGVLRDLRQGSPEAKIMVRRQDFAHLDEALDTLGPAIIEYTLQEDWTEFAACHVRGVAVMIVYMGTETDAMRRIIAARPDLVNLNDPFYFKEICERMGLTCHG